MIIFSMSNYSAGVPKGSSPLAEYGATHLGDARAGHLFHFPIPALEVARAKKKLNCSLYEGPLSMFLTASISHALSIFIRG